MVGRKYHWAPTSGLRHASTDVAPACGGFPDGIVVETLCHQQVKVDKSAVAWLGETCKECNVAVHKLLGQPMPPVSKSR